jgi:hypothetical protein
VIDPKQPLSLESIRAMSDPVVTLWEDFGCGGDQVLWIYARPLPITVTRGDAGFTNDEACSMRLHRLPAGTIIELFEAENGSTRSSWARATTNRYIEEKEVYEFETSFSDVDLTFAFHPRGRSLNGKVSSVIVRQG